MSEQTNKPTMSIEESATIIAKCVAEVVEMSTNENFKNFMKNNLKYKNAEPFESPVIVIDDDLYERTLRELIEKNFKKKCRRSYSQISEEILSQFSQESTSDFSQHSSSKKFRENSQNFQSSQNSFMQPSQSSSKFEQVLGEYPLKFIFDDDELSVLSQHFLDDSDEDSNDETEICSSQKKNSQRTNKKKKRSEE